MKKTIIVILAVVLLLACGNNKTHQTESVIFDNQAGVEQSAPDTIASSVRERVPTMEEKPSTPTSSSSAPHHALVNRAAMTICVALTLHLRMIWTITV